ncbi:sensor domain-containing protein [Halorubrum sp. DTA46]|uniref:sensor domain-containing protein n=1 Tax=Halorubrum sp. DTA46 TaxID=3402162 RepID=UPI003AB06D6D
MVSLRPLSDLPVVGVLVDGRTYRHLLYVLLAIPLGFIYSALFSFGVAFGLLLSVVLVGLVVLFATLLGARLLAGFERWLANRLLAADLDPYDDLPTDLDGRLAGVRKYVDAASTWRGVGFLSVKFAVTVAALVPLFALANGLPLVAAPLRYPFVAEFGESNGEPVTWAIETLPEALLAVPIGIVGVLVALHLTNFIAYVSRQMAAALLGVPAGVDVDGADDNDSPAPSHDPIAADGERGDEAVRSDASDAARSPSESTGSGDTDPFVPADAVEPKSRDGRDSGHDFDR